MRCLDLFSGIGGFSLGLERAGMRTVAFCEIDAYCRRVLAKHWPNVPCYDDIRTLTAERLAADGISVDLICGGFPCQDISNAGKRAGIGGARSGLWSEYARLIGEVRPRYVIVENVAALLGRGLERVLGDLAALGFDAEWHCIPASAVGAPQQRDRLWVLGYTADDAWIPEGQRQLFITRFALAGATDFWEGTAKPPFHGVAYGVPNGSYRRRSIGNAVVPQIPEIIGRAVMRAEMTNPEFAARRGAAGRSPVPPVCQLAAASPERPAAAADF